MMLQANGEPTNIVQISTCMYLIDTYAALTAASAIAANGLLRYVFGGTFPLFTVQSKKSPTVWKPQLTMIVYQRLGIGWATSLLGFFGLVMLPIPWVLYKWGGKIRASSHFETKPAPA